MSLVSSMVLAFAAVLTVLMPVNYRAGADHVHAHTVFQLWIDAATGDSHHHHGDTASHLRTTTVVSIPSPFVAAQDVFNVAVARTTTVRGALHTHGNHAPGATGVEIIAGDAPAPQQPDTAEQVASHIPIQHANTLAALGALIVLLSVGSVRRACWPDGHRLSGLYRSLDPPPPRIAPC